MKFSPTLQSIGALQLLLAAVLATASAEGDDGHAFEWAATFDLSLSAGSIYTWLAQTKGDKYADPRMKLAIFPIPGTTEAHLEAVKEAADGLMIAPPGARLPRSTAMPPSGLNGLSTGKMTSRL